jgi:hypothetical protein
VKVNASPGARIAAILGLIAIVAIGVFLLLRNGGSSGGPVTTATATETSTATTTSTNSNKRTTRRKSSGAKKEGASALDAALSRYGVVVVSLYAPGVAVDSLAAKEAAAGAAAANAGFVAFDVFNERQVRQLAKLLGNLSISNPSVLVFVRPRELSVRLQGFVDRDIVAHAVRIARPTKAAWVSQANAICGRFDTQVTAFGTKLDAAKNLAALTAAQRSEIASAAQHYATLMGEFVRDLNKVSVPTAQRARYKALTAAYRQIATTVKALATAVAGNESTAVSEALNAISSRAFHAYTIASELGLTTCAR